MTKIAIVVLSTLLALTRAEPPRSSYLPPQSRNQFNAAQPSNQYGAPNNNGFASQPRTNYGAPSNNSPRTNYAAPQQQQQQQQPRSQYGPPAQQQSFNAQPSYDLPLEQDFGNNFQQSAPAASYGAPAPAQAYGPPSNSYSDSYSAGGNGNGNGQGYEEPAKYEFQYDVQDQQAALDFGHQEKRDGSVATGKYYVLLPDGRKQIVNYIADENGYRPTITYEEANQGGYDNNAQGGYNGNAQSGYDNNAQSGYRGY